MVQLLVGIIQLYFLFTNNVYGEQSRTPGLTTPIKQPMLYRSNSLLYLDRNYNFTIHDCIYWKNRIVNMHDDASVRMKQFYILSIICKNKTSNATTSFPERSGNETNGTTSASSKFKDVGPQLVHFFTSVGDVLSIVLNLVQNFYFACTLIVMLFYWIYPNGIVHALFKLFIYLLKACDPRYIESVVEYTQWHYNFIFWYDWLVHFFFKVSKETIDVFRDAREALIDDLFGLTDVCLVKPMIEIDSNGDEGISRKRYHQKCSASKLLATYLLSINYDHIDLLSSRNRAFIWLKDNTTVQEHRFSIVFDAAVGIAEQLISSPVHANTITAWGKRYDKKY